MYDKNQWRVNRRNKFRALGLCQRCGETPVTIKLYCPKCAEDIRFTQARLRAIAFEKVLDIYGQVCACCGYSDKRFLTIEHKNNDGYIDRKGNNGGKGFLYKLLREEKRQDIEILCFNCNCGKNRFGGKCCPHKEQVNHATP